jgi:hypothetical protein
MRAGLLWGNMRQLGQRRLPERTTRGSQKNPTHTDCAQATGKILGHALENRVVLTVDRQQHRTRLRTACMNSAPDMTSASLLASRIFLPASTAATLDASPPRRRWRP